MEMMKVVRAYGPGDLRMTEDPIPTPGEGQVLVQVKASGICGSDKWYWFVPGYSERVAGHEVAGCIAAVGPGVYALKEGDRVAVNNVVGCGTCPACRAGDFVRCPNWTGAEDVNHGYSEYVVTPARNCMKLHDSLSYLQGCLVMDNWGTPYGGLQRINARPGMDIVVTGCGPIGLAAVGLATALGASVIAVDPVQDRLDAALRLGARAALKPSTDLPEQVRALTDGLGSHAHLECSGSGKAYETGLKALRIGGDFVTIGEHVEYLLHPSDYVLRRHLSILGTWYSTIAQGREVQDLAVSGRIRLEDLVSHTVSLDEVPGIFGQVIEMSGGIRKCVILM